MRRKIGILIPLLFAFQPLTSAIAAKEVTYYLTDNQGTPLATTDAQGNVTGLFEITPYGVARLDPPGTIGFGGHVVDDAVTAIYMQSRYYDPSTGRFLSTDPAGVITGNVRSFGRYDYGLGNPFRFSDPTGADAVEDQRNAPMLPPTIVNAIRWPDPVIIGGSTIGTFIDDQRTSISKPIKVQEKSFDEIADCVKSDRWDWGQMGPAGDDISDVGSTASAGIIANTAGNFLAGPTGSGIANVSHATSWQHAVSARIGQAAQRLSTGRSFGPLQARISSVGKLTGRLAILPTIWEGFYDLTAAGRCSRMKMT